MTLLAAKAQRVLAVPRNIDTMPPAGLELFASVFGLVPNDGLAHTLLAPVGVPMMPADQVTRVRIKFVRVEWSTVDLVVPPPLTLTAMINGQASVALGALTKLMLLPTAIGGTPALERNVFVEVAPGATLSVAVTNTGTVTQLVCAYLTGWTYPQTLIDGAAYQ